MELKCCPFCGGAVETDENGRGLWWVHHYCRPLKSWIGTNWFDSEEEAAERWNRRNEHEFLQGSECIEEGEEGRGL